MKQKMPPMPVVLDAPSTGALHVKSEVYRKGLSVPLGIITVFSPPTETLALLSPEYDDIPQGEFLGLESIRLRWVKPDWFEYIPYTDNPFRFRRASGELITPRRMFTDGGSIPRAFWFKDTLSPWGYAPAFLVHDWEFDFHHCGRSEKSFEAVRDTMAEGVKTLMEAGLCPKSILAFKALFVGIDSFVARALWDERHPGCPLPPDGGD